MTSQAKPMNVLVAVKVAARYVKPSVSLAMATERGRLAAELAAEKSACEELHKRDVEQRQEIAALKADLAAERSGPASKRLADLMKTYQEVCQQCTGLSADLANERAFRQEDRQTLEIVKGNLAAERSTLTTAQSVIIRMEGELADLRRQLEQSDAIGKNNYEALKMAHREVEVLRQYGNKACTAMADDALMTDHYGNKT